MFNDTILNNIKWAKEEASNEYIKKILKESYASEFIDSFPEKYQTIVVTHSPQVTAKGVNHYLIKKETIDNETVSATIELSHEERVEEIARMLSDNMITNEARLAATKLLEKNESRY